jgi:hypothetical protein
MPADALDDETALIDCRLGILLLERAAQGLNCPDFGLRISARQDVGILGPLAFALRHSATVGEGLECTSRYFFVHSNAFSLSVHRASRKGGRGGKMAELRFDLLAPGIPLARQFWDLCLGTTCRVFKFLTQDAYPIKAAHFPHAPLASVSTYRKQFGETVLFEQAQAALLVDSEAFRLGAAAIALWAAAAAAANRACACILIFARSLSGVGGRGGGGRLRGRA